MSETPTDKTKRYENSFEDNKPKTDLDSYLTFQASEAYKLLRTNLMFSLTDQDKCHIIGVTSSIGGEGKSTTAKNLAISLAEAKKKVLLLDFDLRLPTVAKLFSMRTKPGITNLLADFSTYEDVIHKGVISKNLDIIVSGDIPPNPSEILGSENTIHFLEDMSKVYDFIIVDLPPINVVSDTLIVSKLLDGIIMVVRQDYNHKKDLNEALRRIKMVDAKILGFVLNDSSTEAITYKGNYRHKYYRDYDHNYGKAGKKTKK